MGPLLDKTPGDSNDPIKQLCGESRRALASSFDPHRERARHMVDQRPDPRLRAPLDASEVVQDVLFDVPQVHSARPRIVDAFFALVRDRRREQPGTGSFGITG
jgi:hypothetical protein